MSANWILVLAIGWFCGFFIQTWFNDDIRVLPTYVVNFIRQKMQQFQVDSEYLGKINTKIFFFQR